MEAAPSASSVSVSGPADSLPFPSLAPPRPVVSGSGSGPDSRAMQEQDALMHSAFGQRWRRSGVKKSRPGRAAGFKRGWPPFASFWREFPTASTPQSSRAFASSQGGSLVSAATQQARSRGEARQRGQGAISSHSARSSRPQVLVRVSPPPPCGERRARGRDVTRVTRPAAKTGGASRLELAPGALRLLSLAATARAQSG